MVLLLVRILLTMYKWLRNGIFRTLSSMLPPQVKFEQSVHQAVEVPELDYNIVSHYQVNTLKGSYHFICPEYRGTQLEMLAIIAITSFYRYLQLGLELVDIFAIALFATLNSDNNHITSADIFKYKPEKVRSTMMIVSKTFILHSIYFC